MSKTGFKCPDCGNEDEFIAYELEIAGPISVTEDGYEPCYGKGLHYDIPDGALMVCRECGKKHKASAFRKAYMDAWYPEEE